MNDLLFDKRTIDLTAGELADVMIEKLKFLQPKNQDQPDNDEYLTPEEVCKKYKISKSTLWRWNQEGYLCHYELGGKRYYKESDIKEKMIKL